MVRTKQTKHGGSSTRPAGMQVATYGDQPEVQTSSRTSLNRTGQIWTNQHNLQKRVKQVSQQVKQVKVKVSKDVGKPTTTGAEGGAEAPPNTAEATTVNPPMDPQAGTSKDDPQAPTNIPKDPQDENKPVLVEYVRSYQQAAKVWFDTVQASKEQAYITLYDKLYFR